MVGPRCFKLALTKRWAGQGKGGVSLGRATPFPPLPALNWLPATDSTADPPCTYAPSYSGAVKEAQCSPHVGTPSTCPCSIRGMHRLRYSPSKHGLLVREGPSPLQATR